MTDRKYLVAGPVTDEFGVTKVRWGNDLVFRIKSLAKKGCTNINLVEFPYPMDKTEGLAYLKTLGFTGADLEAIDFRIDERKLEQIKAAQPRRTRRTRSAKSTLSLEEIRARKNITAENIIAAVVSDN